MRVGFTGTRNELTDKQFGLLTLKIQKLRIDNPYDICWIIHGDCVGADEKAHIIAASCGYSKELFPCNLEKYRAYCDGDIIHEVKPPLVRNKLIVNASDIMLACPPTNEEIERGGTWYTIRFAKQQKKPLVIFYPNGEVEELNINDGDNVPNIGHL